MDDLEDFIDFYDDDEDDITIRDVIAAMIDYEAQGHYLQQRFCHELRCRNDAGQREVAKIFIEEVRKNPLARNLPQYEADPALDGFSNLLIDIVTAERLKADIEKAKAECPLPPPPTNSLDF